MTPQNTNRVGAGSKRQAYPGPTSYREGCDVDATQNRATLTLQSGPQSFPELDLILLMAFRKRRRNPANLAKTLAVKQRDFWMAVIRLTLHGLIRYSGDVIIPTALGAGIGLPPDLPSIDTLRTPGQAATAKVAS